MYFEFTMICEPCYKGKKVVSKAEWIGWHIVLSALKNKSCYGIKILNIPDLYKIDLFRSAS